jgi:uncharacterized protein
VQKAWIAQRDACRTDKACIRNAYAARIAQLHGGAPARAQMSCADAHRVDDFREMLVQQDALPTFVGGSSWGKVIRSAGIKAE